MDSLPILAGSTELVKQRMPGLQVARDSNHSRPIWSARPIRCRFRWRNIVGNNQIVYQSPLRLPYRQRVHNWCFQRRTYQTYPEGNGKQIWQSAKEGEARNHITNLTGDSCNPLIYTWWHQHLCGVLCSIQGVFAYWWIHMVNLDQPILSPITLLWIGSFCSGRSHSV